MLSLSRWRPRHLLLAWVAYWAALFAVTLGPAVIAAISVINDTQGHSSINASFGDGSFVLTIARGATTVWHGSAHALAIALWVGVPPLLLWALWLSRRQRVNPAPAAREVVS
jgi:hypothetical protein